MAPRQLPITDFTARAKGNGNDGDDEGVIDEGEDLYDDIPEDIIEDPEAERLHRDQLHNICSALGYWEEDEVKKGNQPGRRRKKYVAGDQVLDCLRDLKRHIQIDENESRVSTRIWLWKWDILERDLYPLFRNYQSNYRIATLTLEILTLLTWPASWSLRDTAEPELDLNHIGPAHEKKLFLKNRILASYRKAFSKSWRILETAMFVVAKLLTMPRKNFKERDALLLKMAVALIRNVMRLPVNKTSGKIEEFESLVIAMDKALVVDFVLCITSTGIKRFTGWIDMLVEFVGDFLQGCGTYARVKRGKNDQLTSASQSSALVDGSSLPTIHHRFHGAYKMKLNSGQLVTTDPKLMIPGNLHLLDNVGKKVRTAIGTISLRREQKEFRMMGMLYESIDVMKAVDRFLSSFVRKSFNPFFDALNRKLHMDDAARLSLQAVTHKHAQYFRILRLSLELVCQRIEDNDADFAVEHVAAAFKPEVVQRMGNRLVESLEMKQWVELRENLACIYRYIAFLNLMLEAPKDIPELRRRDYRQVAESLYCKSLFYEGGLRDSLVHLAASRPRHCASYLRVLVPVIHEYLKALEGFCRNQDIQVLQKRRKTDVVLKELEEAEMNGNKDVLKYMRLEKLGFNKYQGRFCTHSVIATYMTLLKSITFSSKALRAQSAKEDLIWQSDTQLAYYICRMFYRIALKAEEVELFFQLSFLSILSDARRVFPKTFTELTRFVATNLRDAMCRRPMLIIEIMGPKSSGLVEELKTGSNFTIPPAQHQPREPSHATSSDTDDDGDEEPQRRPRPLMELHGNGSSPNVSGTRFSGKKRKIRQHNRRRPRSGRFYSGSSRESETEESGDQDAEIESGTLRRRGKRGHGGRLETSGDSFLDSDEPLPLPPSSGDDLSPRRHPVPLRPVTEGMIDILGMYSDESIENDILERRRRRPVTNSKDEENVQESYLDGLSSIPIWHVYITGSVMAVVFPILEVLWELGEVTTVLQMIFETLDGILSLALTVAATNLLKYIFAWPRPYFCDQLQTWIAENRSTPYDPVSKTVHSEFADTLKSFPSGHSSSSSAIAAIFTVFHIKRLLALISSREHEQYNIGTLLKAVWHTIWIMGIWVFPSIVMSSRIHDHKHSPVDVSFGFLLGVVIPAAVLVVSPALTSRMGKEWNGRSTRRDPSHAHS